MVARHRPDGTFDLPQKCSRAFVELLGADVHEVAREKHRVGMQGVDTLREACEVVFGPDDRAHVDVADLHEPVVVERLGNAVGADFDFAHADRRAAPRRAPEEEEREARGDGIARAAQVQEIEDVECQARQYGDDPSPEQPHIKIHQSRAVIGAEDVDDRRNERQGIRRGGHAIQGLAPRNMPVPVAPEMDEIRNNGCQGEEKHRQKKHIP